MAVFVSGLAGCATVSDLRNKPADVTLEATRAPADVGACVASGWGEFFGVKVNQAPAPGGGYSVNLPSDNAGSNGVADITPSASGSHVEVRYRMSGLSWHEKYTAVLKRCSA